MILSKLDLNKINYSNQYKYGDAFDYSIVLVLTHPLNLCRVLMQLGYEPLRPILVNTLFHGSKYAYPSIFKYMNYIKTEDGYSGLFRGCGFRVCSELTKDFLYVNGIHVCEQIDNQLKNIDPNEKKKKRLKNSEDNSDDEMADEDDKSAKFNKEQIIKLIRNLVCKSASKILAITISYPIHVCFVRSCSQFIGREKFYDFNPSNLTSIIKQGHFYDGFAPKLIAELLVLWISSCIVFSFKSFMKPDEMSLTYASQIINFFTSSAFYPLQLTSTIMSVNHCPTLLASKIEPPFLNWRTCYNSLERRNQTKRGSSLLWRYIANAYKPQAIISKYVDDE